MIIMIKTQQKKNTLNTISTSTDKNQQQNNKRKINNDNDNDINKKFDYKKKQ